MSSWGGDRMGDYSYKLSVFEGPLDLLLHLIEKHKIDIYDIPIVSITSQYMDYLDNWNHFDIHYSSEFLVMAATLMQIKSRMLLPKVEPAPEGEEDPRDELVNRLVEFKAIKEITAFISDRTSLDASIYTRPEEVSQLGKESFYSFDVSKLYEIFKDTFKRAQEEEVEPPQVQVEKDAYSLEDMLDTMLLRARSGDRMSFRRLLVSSRDKKEMVTVFMAVLELMKRQELVIIPGDREDDIILVNPHHLGEEERPEYLDLDSLPDESLTGQAMVEDYEASTNGNADRIEEEDSHGRPSPEGF